MPPRHADQPPSPLLKALPALVESECRRLGISQREAARDLGLSGSTITRIIQGKGCDAHTLLVLIPWLDLTADWLDDADEAWNAYWRGWNDAETRIRAALASPRPGAPEDEHPAAAETSDH